MTRSRAPLRFLWPLLVGAVALGAGAPRTDAAEAQGPAHKTTQSESYIPVDPMYATIIEGERPRGLLLVELGLDVPDEKFRDRVTLALPLLRDAYMRSLLVYGATAVRPGRQPNIEDIAGRMQTITDKVMGRAGARVLMAQTAIRITH